MATKPPKRAKKATTARSTAGRGSLVVVESPAKARTIQKYLGRGYRVKASVGHVKDLPKSELGVDLENNFSPKYVLMRGKSKVMADIKKAAREVAQVYLAPDPDREGEAIAWHIAEELKPVTDNIHRILLTEITKRGVTEALAAPQPLDQKKFESQQARRILDRLVGYQISPILWRKVRRGLSAGRVQSVAVRMIVEREREVKAFVPEEYWSVTCALETPRRDAFHATLATLDGEKAERVPAEIAQAVASQLRESALTVTAVERKERRRYAPPPFITARLQQDGVRQLRMTAKRTMALAQRLYEGVDLGDEGAVGLITYMRTDSTRISPDALSEARRYIAGHYGADHLPEAPNVYRNRKGAQDAHEAIRPTSMEYDPERVRALLQANVALEREQEDLLRLYTLIWNRFIACQMRPAIYDQTTVLISAGRAGLRASGSVLKFAGFVAVYEEASERDGESAEQPEETLPEIHESEALRLLDVLPEQHFTQPPPRFSEASLIKELEENGIGRPSTYASILSTIQERGYVSKIEARLLPTELGMLVNDLLVHSFPDVLNVEFTAKMEEELDEVEEGTKEWLAVLHEFHQPFRIDLEKAEAEMKDLKRTEEQTGLVCDLCSAPMVKRWGRRGYFLACSAYPACRNTRDFTQEADGTLVAVVVPETNETCEACNAPMLIRNGRFGSFLGCSRYPECKTVRPISLGINCPRPECTGFLHERRSRRGRSFYGCSAYSKTGCNFVSWDRPVAEPCPECNAPFLVRKDRKSGSTLRCVKEGCSFTQDLSAVA